MRNQQVDSKPMSTESLPEEGEVQEIAESVTVDAPEGEMTVEEITYDLLYANKQITDYRKGALFLAAALQERELEARQNGDTEIGDVVEEVKESALTLYSRLWYGDRQTLEEGATKKIVSQEIPEYIEKEDDDQLED